MPKHLAAYDIGTSGVKAGVFSPDGRLLASGYREYGLISPSPCWSEQSVEEMWRAQCEASREMMDRASLHPKDIAAVAVSCQRATFVALDKKGTPLTNFIGWQDKRSVEQCETIRSRMGDARYYEISGLPIEPTAAISKILWLKEHASSVFEQATQFASTQNLHLMQLGVENPPCDLADAAYLGLLDVDGLRWSDELLETFGIPRDKMPPLAPSGKVVGKVSKGASEATGLAKGTPIVTAGGDLQCAGLGVGITRPGLVGVGVGSGADVLIYLDKPARHPNIALSCLPHVVEGAWEMEGLSLASGATYKWFRDKFILPDSNRARFREANPYIWMDELAAKVPAGSVGVLVLPCLMGAGAPNWDPMVRGVILGLTPDTDRNVLARAILEGVCLEIRWMLEAVEQLGTRPGGLRIYGGAAKSHLWNQIAADVYGIPVSRMATNEAGLVGAAICSGVGVGVFASAQEGADSMVSIVEEIEPNSSVKPTYDELFEIYKKAYSALVSSGVQAQITRLGSCDG